jgi:hypothetical protein
MRVAVAVVSPTMRSAVNHTISHTATLNKLTGAYTTPALRALFTVIALPLPGC